MSHAPQRTDLPPECAQVYGLLERCRARVATRNVIERAFNALGYASHMVGKWHLGYSEFLQKSARLRMRSKRRALKRSQGDVF